MEATVHPCSFINHRGAHGPAAVSLLRVCAWESPVGSGGGAQRDLTTRNLRENRQSQTMCRGEGGRGSARGEARHTTRRATRLRGSLSTVRRREEEVEVQQCERRSTKGLNVLLRCQDEDRRPSGSPRGPERRPRGWEAETGPPLTSEGLSVSCNRKWERRWREKTRSRTPSSLHRKVCNNPAPVRIHRPAATAARFALLRASCRVEPRLSHCGPGRCRRLQPGRLGHAPVAVSSGLNTPRSLPLQRGRRWAGAIVVCVVCCVWRSVSRAAVPWTQPELPSAPPRAALCCSFFFFFFFFFRRWSRGVIHVTSRVLMCAHPLCLWLWLNVQRGWRLGGLKGFCWRRRRRRRGSVPLERCCGDSEGFSLAPPSLTGRSRVATGSKYAIIVFADFIACG